MMRNLGSVCAKVGRRGRSYRAGRCEDSSLSKSGYSEEKPSLVPSGLLLAGVVGYCWYGVTGMLEYVRMMKVLNEKRAKIRILLREYESRVKEVNETELKVWETAREYARRKM